METRGLALMTQSSSRTSEFLLDGNVAVITGGGSGIGRAIARCGSHPLVSIQTQKPFRRKLPARRDGIGARLDVNHQAQVASTFGLEDLSFHERQLK